MVNIVASVCRLILPILLPTILYLLCPDSPHRFRNSALYPPLFVCQLIALIVLLGIGIAWCSGDASIAKDVSYLILTLLLAGSILLNCKEAQTYRQLISNVTIFMIGFLIYSAADGSGVEKVTLAPVVAVFLIDMILSIQTVELGREEELLRLKTLEREIKKEIKTVENS